MVTLAVAAGAKGQAPSVEVVARVPDARTSLGPLLFAKDGRIFGTSITGGTRGEGSLFVIDKSGDAKTLVHFDHNSGGAFPFGPIVEAPDGSIMGATVQGGNGGAGTIYKVTADGSLQTLVTFDPAGARHPYGGLAASRERPGVYYGSTYESGAMGKGTWFEVTADGKIRYLSTDLFGPFGPLVVTTGDKIYGTTFWGGNIKVRPNTNISVGAIFKGSSASIPQKIVDIKFGGHGGAGDLFALSLDARNAIEQRLIAKGDDAFFFVNHAGGKFSEGSLFTMAANGALKSWQDFNKGDSLGGPITEIVVADDGSVYGAMGPTQVYSTTGNRMTKTPLKGALCQVFETGESKIVWALDGGGPAESLSWHDGAIYGFQNGTLYRLILRPGTPSK
jgi:uncharacterized repeat protein (TIGR03803 family)